jgi:CheY-like chemotaxis protein
VSEDHPILLIEDDLFFSSTLLSAVRRLGLEAILVDSRTQVLERVRTAAPAAILINLASRSLGSLDRIRELKADAGLRAVPVVGYCGHLETDLIAAGRSAGCDVVVANSAITSNLSDVLCRAGVPAARSSG